MNAKLSMVTLGVDDLSEATKFYESIGFERSQTQSNDNVTFFHSGGVILGLFGRAALAEDAATDIGVAGKGAVALAQNLPSERAVDDYMQSVGRAGAKILKAPQKVFWGGYSGYFSDPEGHVWEVAYNPFWSFADNGTIIFPDE